MKVLLINPFCISSVDDLILSARIHNVNADEPLGLCYISSYLKRETRGVEIELFDAHIEALRLIAENPDVKPEALWGIVKEKIENYQTDVIGISGLYHTNRDMLHETAKVAKEVDKSVIVVIGGMYPTTSMEQALSDPNIDYAISGEGELPFRDFIMTLCEQGDVTSLDNISFINGDGKLICKDNRRIIEDLNQLPLPDRSTIPNGYYSIYGRSFVSRYVDTVPRTAAIASSRGCLFRCSFCSGHNITMRKYRLRKIGDVINEIKYLIDKFGIEIIVFNEEIANGNRQWTLDFYRELIKQKLGIKWLHSGGFSIALLDREEIELAIESGLLAFDIAIESGSMETLHRLHKPTKGIQHVYDVIEIIRNYDQNIHIGGYFLVGFPWETLNGVQLTLDLAESLDLDWCMFNIFQPFPGCELVDYCRQHNLLENEEEDSLKNVFYLHSKLKLEHLNVDYLDKLVYERHILINFINNRSLRQGNYSQARRDFQHVVNIAPEHAVAYYCLGKLADRAQSGCLCYNSLDEPL